MGERLLRVEAPHFVAGAVFKKTDAGWRVVHAAPILAWMRKMAIEDIGPYLRRKGWLCTWHQDHP